MVKQGSPTSGPQSSMSCQISRSISLKTKCTIHVICLNHSETIPAQPWSVGKLSSMKWVPGIKNIGDHCQSYRLESLKMNIWLLSSFNGLHTLKTRKKRSRWRKPWQLHLFSSSVGKSPQEAVFSDNYSNNKTTGLLSNWLNFGGETAAPKWLLCIF